MPEQKSREAGQERGTHPPLHAHSASRLWTMVSMWYTHVTVEHERCSFVALHVRHVHCGERNQGLQGRGGTGDIRC
jgi:hypothetical protein